MEPRFRGSAAPHAAYPRALKCPSSTDRRDGGKKLLDEGFTTRPAFGGVSTVNAVDEFDDTHRR